MAFHDTLRGICGFPVAARYPMLNTQDDLG
jgi:hypothetical protein